MIYCSDHTTMGDEQREYPSRLKANSSLKRYVTLKREEGSCAEYFKQVMAKSFKTGLCVGVPFGAYVAYRYHETYRVKSFLATTSMACFTTTTAFCCLGLLAATYNCLRVKM
uniref:Transmembrane protein n=1 Tax=Parascaris univalens TaxID=6257 RepID=A0A914ZWC7_PARUN